MTVYSLECQPQDNVKSRCSAKRRIGTFGRGRRLNPIQHAKIGPTLIWVEL